MPGTDRSKGGVSVLEYLLQDSMAISNIIKLIQMTLEIEPSIKVTLVQYQRFADDAVTGQILFLYIIRKDNQIVERRLGMSIEV